YSTKQSGYKLFFLDRHLFNDILYLQKNIFSYALEGSVNPSTNLHYSQTEKERQSAGLQFKSPTNLHYSQTCLLICFIDLQFKLPTNLHYSQTGFGIGVKYTLFKLPTNLHYSQTNVFTFQFQP